MLRGYESPQVTEYIAGELAACGDEEAAQAVRDSQEAVTAGIDAVSNGVACAGTIVQGAAFTSWIPVIGPFIGATVVGALNPACHTAVTSTVEALVNTDEAFQGFDDSDGCSSEPPPPATASCDSDQTPQGDAAVREVCVQHACTCCVRCPDGLPPLVRLRRRWCVWWCCRAAAQLLQCLHYLLECIPCRRARFPASLSTLTATPGEAAPLEARTAPASPALTVRQRCCHAQHASSPASLERQHSCPS